MQWACCPSMQGEPSVPKSFSMPQNTGQLCSVSEIPTPSSLLKRTYTVINIAHHKCESSASAMGEGLAPLLRIKLIFTVAATLHITNVTSCPCLSYLPWHFHPCSCVIPILLQGFHCSCVYISHKSAYLFLLDLLAEEMRQGGRGKCIFHKSLFLYVHCLAKGRDHAGITQRNPVVVPPWALRNRPLHSWWAECPPRPCLGFLRAHRWMSALRFLRSQGLKKALFLTAWS